MKTIKSTPTPKKENRGGGPKKKEKYI